MQQLMKCGNSVQGGRHPSGLGMAGYSADPASLLRIYLDFDRVAEATTLLLEFLQAWATSVSFTPMTGYEHLQLSLSR